MEIIRKRQRITTKSFSLKWEREDGSGYSFNCDEHGVVDESAMYPQGLENLALCRAGKMEGYTGPSIEIYTNTHTEHGIGLCHCGEKVTLAYFTNTCKCGEHYNDFGERLGAPIEQWGEETGEHLVDILNINLLEDH